MEIVELLVQGVAGLPARGRWQLPGGHVVLSCASPLLPLLRTLLYFDGNPDDGSALLAAEPGARAALAIRGRGGTVWRLVRELGGGLSLQRWNEAASRFEGVASAAAELGPLLRAQVGVTSRAIFDELFSLDGERLGGLLAAPAVELAAPPAPVPMAPPSAPAPDRAALERNVAALERELEASGKVDVLQRQLDAALHELAAHDRERAVVATAEAAVAAARGELRRFDAIEALPDDVGPLLEAHRTAEKDRNEALRRIADDRAAWEARSARAAASPAPPWKDPRVYAAIGTGLAALGIGLFTPARIVALLNVPAFGVAAALGVRWAGQLQAAESMGRMSALLAERERRVEEQWAAASALLVEALGRAGVQTPAELEEMVQARAAARAKVGAAEAELEQVRARSADAVAKAEALRAEVTRLEEEIGVLGAGAYRPRGVVERELAAARSRLDGRAAPEPAPLVAGDLPPGLLDALPLPTAAAPARQQPGGFALRSTAATADPCVRLLEHAAELAAIDVHEIGGRAAQRVGQYLAVLTGRRFTGATLSSTTGLRCAGESGPVPFASLAGVERVRAWIALQLTLVEMASARQAIPLIYDDPLARLDTGDQRLVARLLQGLGGRTQVIHRSSLATVAEHADARLVA